MTAVFPTSHSLIGKEWWRGPFQILTEPSSCSAKKGEDSFINMIAVGEKKPENKNLKLHLRSFKNLRLYVYTMGRA